MGLNSGMSRRYFFVVMGMSFLHHQALSAFRPFTEPSKVGERDRNSFIPEISKNPTRVFAKRTEEGTPCANPMPTDAQMRSEIWPCYAINNHNCEIDFNETDVGMAPWLMILSWFT
ncbi:hypothetical protein PoB_003474300 [Plakobranchus ocellatus]|uniref:Uncharacterized protein n=1 Tax=Plakobranchus ocellatus TaxID=259542 RepID=A0AAV4AN67_9GAST|nr:hypothetical protein PoB_003474300 [Plakobranchus ocellatus]